MENGLLKRKWQPILLKMGLTNPKNSKDENFGDLKLFKNRNLENYLQNEVWENYFQNQRGLEKGKMTCGPRVTCIRWPCKTGRACGSSAQVRLPSLDITDIGLKKS